MLEYMNRSRSHSFAFNSIDRKLELSSFQEYNNITTIQVRITHHFGR